MLHKLLEGSEDAVHVTACLPFHEEEEDNPILQPSTPDSSSVKEPQIKVQESQSKRVFTPVQSPVVKSDRVLSVNVIDNVRIPKLEIA